jgi:chromosome segregation ATPase
MLTDLEAAATEAEKMVHTGTEDMEQRLGKLKLYTDDMVEQLERRMAEAAEDMEQKVLEETDAKFEEYRAVQAEQFRMLAALSDDGKALDAELRQYLKDTETQVKEEVARFEQNSTQARTRTADDFNDQMALLKGELESISEEIEKLKAASYQNVSEKLQLFEDDFAQNLGQRSADIDRRIQDLEKSLRERFDDSVRSLKEQLLQDMGEVRNTVETTVNTDIERYALSMADQLKQSQGLLDERLQELRDQADSRNKELADLMNASRQDVDQWQTGFQDRLQAMDASMNEAQGHAQGLDAAIKDADMRIKEFAEETKLFERADAMKADLEQRIAELHQDFEGIEDKKAEIKELEAQVNKIKRLEDEVNAKMTRFFSEKHRIDQLESDFDRLLKTSQSVEEKLAQISNSDDTLQALQVQFRKLNDASVDVEEKYQRIERKNATLDVTNEGIDRNFKTLQESEKMVQNIYEDMRRLTNQIAELDTSIETLSKDNEKAKETAGKLILLNDSLSSIEERIEQMQVARQWIAGAETRIEELNKQLQALFKIATDSMREGNKIREPNKGAPPPADRENIKNLARQGWKIDEIARAMKLSRGEVELILELGAKD